MSNIERENLDSLGFSNHSSGDHNNHNDDDDDDFHPPEPPLFNLPPSPDHENDTGADSNPKMSWEKGKQRDPAPAEPEPPAPGPSQSDFEYRRQDQEEYWELPQRNEPRRSLHHRNIPKHPGNTFGENHLPSNIIRDQASERYWRKTVGKPEHVLWNLLASRQKLAPAPAPLPPASKKSLLDGDPMDIYDENLNQIIREGGEDFFQYMLSKTGYIPTKNLAPVNPVLRQKFQQVIGSLMYLMIGTRSDIAFAVTKLPQQSVNPSQEHLDKVLHIMRYLLGIANYAITYDGSSNEGLIAYTDSNWASDFNTRRSTTGFFLSLSAGIITWNSRTQKLVTLSSTEAKYMALSDTCCQVMWMRSLLKEIGFDQPPTTIAADNEGSIFIGSNPVQDQRTKHIDIRYHYIRENVKNGNVAVVFIDGTSNPADMFTKNLPKDKFLMFRSQLGLEFYSLNNLQD